MTRISTLRRDKRGAAIVEFALSLPILVLMIWGIFQLGIIFQANAGMQHALGEGARYATIFPTPTNTQITTRISDKVFGTKIGSFGTPTITTPATSVCTNCRDLSVTFTMTPNFLFFNGPNISITRSKRVYLAT